MVTPARHEGLQPFKYQRPASSKPKDIVQFPALEDIQANKVRLMVQVVREGGENNLHSHSRQHAFWFVLGGTARFYDAEDKPFEIGEQEGIIVPAGTRYWFESAGGDTPLEILQISAFEGEDVRTDFAPRTAATESSFESVGFSGKTVAQFDTVD